jgi:aminoglycoside phosphotransferase (APT) family kinase protein
VLEHKSMTDLSLHRAFTTIVAEISPGSSLVRSWPLTGGVSAHVDALELQHPTNGRQCVVVRRHTDAVWKSLEENVTSSEFRLLSSLYKHGFPVPEPLWLDATCKVLPSPFLVVRKVDGTTEFPTSNRHAALQQMAERLAQLHNLDTSSLDLPSLPQREDPIAGALSYVPEEPSWEQLRAVIRNYSAISSEKSLLHGDYWPGNIMWKDNQLVAILDWEDAALGSATSDLACCRAELNVILTGQEVQYFTEQYIKVSNQEIQHLALWDSYVGFAALASMHNWGLPAHVEHLRRERTLKFVTQAAQRLVG